MAPICTEFYYPGAWSWSNPTSLAISPAAWIFICLQMSFSNVWPFLQPPSLTSVRLDSALDLAFIAAEEFRGPKLNRNHLSAKGFARRLSPSAPQSFTPILSLVRSSGRANFRFSLCLRGIKLIMVVVALLTCFFVFVFLHEKQKCHKGPKDDVCLCISLICLAGLA